ncbi:HHL1-like protein [Coleofasciculus sp. H7-2]|uniref:HHL1-like protein n=1 Tax=Coleofasciculus sp. H7-2 TaxID=3351545 RepID=UPI00367036AE
MTSNSGFGKVQKTKKARHSSAKRTEASKQYDKMKGEGVPEFNIYIRIQGKKNWFPVGSLAVNRTSKINQAIFDTQEDLRQGAFRLFPVLRKNQNNLEYGYRLKGSEYADEPIQVAVPPQPSIPNAIQATIDKLKNSFSALLKRG